jgi:hypothetical protein
MKRPITVSALVLALLASPLGLGPEAHAVAGRATAPAGLVQGGGAERLPVAKGAMAERAIIVAQRHGRPDGGRPPMRQERPRHGNHNGIEIGVGIAILAIIAASIAKSSGYKSAVRKCARDYRGFDRESGTYVTRSGNVRLCPYLEPYVD